VVLIVTLLAVILGLAGVLYAMGNHDDPDTVTNQTDTNTTIGTTAAPSTSTSSTISSTTTSTDPPTTTTTTPPPVEIPDVTGQDQGTATTTLQNLGLEVDPKTAPSDTVDAGKVISTDPAAGKTVDPGATVTLLVSSGPDQVTVPGVVGQTEATAQAQLEAAGLKSSSNPVVVTSADQNGIVQSQNPAAGSQAKAGSTVQIDVGEAATASAPHA
jgi:serine/threonine-protein kinase